jgi:hypothetical protein
MNTPLIRTVAFALWACAIGETVLDQVFSGRARVVVAEFSEAKIKRAKVRPVI